VLIIGAITPIGAEGEHGGLRCRRRRAGWRTSGAAPPWRIAEIPVSVAAVSHSPCCWSMVTATKPSRAQRLDDQRRRQAAPAGVDGLAAASRRASEKPGAGHGMPSRWP